uniref:Mucin-17-like isoform X2 n=1 Tax=Crassostrea virginica TaxID=6565 RepID=A0A8B8ASB8_CRAVI|nr:mucin-17-like isoform X2 [Crassostrea virginica]
MLSVATFVLFVLQGLSLRIQEAESTYIEYSSTTDYNTIETSTFTERTTKDEELQSTMTSPPLTKDISRVTDTTEETHEFQAGTASSPQSNVTYETEDSPFNLGISTEGKTAGFEFSSATDYRTTTAYEVIDETTDIEFKTNTILSLLTTVTYKTQDTPLDLGISTEAVSEYSSATEYTTNESSGSDDRTTEIKTLTDATTTKKEFKTQKTSSPLTTTTFKSTEKDAYVTQTIQQKTEATTRTTKKFTEPTTTPTKHSTTLKTLTSASKSTPTFTAATSATTFQSTEETEVIQDIPSRRSENVNVSSVVLGLMLAISLMANMILAFLLYKSCRKQIPVEEDKNKLYTNEISLSKIEHETTYTGIQFTDDNPAYQYESLSRQNEATYSNTIP